MGVGSGGLVPVGVGGGGLVPSVGIVISDRGDGGALTLWLVVFSNVAYSQAPVLRAVYE